MDGAAKGIPTAGGRRNSTIKTTQGRSLAHPPSAPEADGARTGAQTIAPSRAPQPETIAIQGFRAPERSFGGVHDLKTVTLDKPSGEMDRPETTAFRVSPAAILDPGGAVQGTDTERSQSLIREAAKLPSPSDKISFLRQNQISVVADYSITNLGNRHLLVIDRELEIRSAPYEGTGIEFTPQGKGHIEFLNKAALSREYGSAVTGYHVKGDRKVRRGAGEKCESPPLLSPIFSALMSRAFPISIASTTPQLPPSYPHSEGPGKGKSPLAECVNVIPAEVLRGLSEQHIFS